MFFILFSLSGVGDFSYFYIFTFEEDVGKLGEYLRMHALLLSGWVVSYYFFQSFESDRFGTFPVNQDQILCKDFVKTESLRKMNIL